MEMAMDQTQGINVGHTDQIVSLVLGGPMALSAAAPVCRGG
jgi:hypothetical protein